MNFICINIEIVYNIPFGTLTDGNYGICILACLPEFIRINETVNGWITLWIAQKKLNHGWLLRFGCELLSGY